MLRQRRILIVALVAGVAMEILAAGGVASAALTVSTWQGASGGTWSTAGNWNNGVPSQGSGNPPTDTWQAVIDGSLSGGAVVVLDGQYYLSGLTIASGYTVQGDATTDRRLRFNTSTDFVFNNAGTITSNQGVGMSILTANSNYTFVNSGYIQADGTTNANSLLNFQANNGTTLTITNTGGTIRTLGQSSMSLNPQGDFVINGGTISNNALGTMTTYGNRMSLSNVTFNNAGTYTFTLYGIDNGAGVGLLMSGTSSFTNSGTLTFNNWKNHSSSAKNAIYRLAINPATGSFNNSGTINIIQSGEPTAAMNANNVSAQLNVSDTGTLTNTGTINLISEAPDSTIHPFAALTINSGKTVTLSGSGGEVVMKVAANTDSYNNLNTGHVGDVTLVQIRAYSGNATLINSAGHTIRGCGQLGYGNLTMTNNGTINADDAAYAMTIKPYASGSFTNNSLLLASGAGGLVLDATTTGTYNNTSTGTVRVDSGSSLTINTNATLNNAGKLIVNGTLTNNGGSLVVQNGSTVGGAGTIGYDLALNSTTKKLAPGNSPGTLSLGVSQNWSAYTYQWELNDWNGPVGTNADTVQITGNLALTGGSGSYVLSVISLMANNNPGDVGAGGGATFAESIRSWDILTTTGTITGFDAANWTLDTSGFSPSFAGSWAIDINGAGNALVLTYVPEPTCMAMVLLGGAGLLFRRRK